MDSSFLVLLANAKDGTISSFDLTDGVLSLLALSEVGAPGLPLAVDQARGLVYAGTSDPIGISVLTLDRASGRLNVRARESAMGAPTYLKLSSDGRMLFSASYHQGLGEVWRIADDATFSPAAEPVRYRNLHSVQLSSDDAFAYFVSLRDDLVAQCAVARDTGLIPLDPPTVAAPPGCGPRHIVLDAAQTSVYVITEYSGEVLHYRRDPASGLLKQASHVSCIPPGQGLSHSRFGANPRQEDLIWGSDLHLDGSGRRLYCAERTRGTITAIEVAEDGSLGQATAHSNVVAQPRGFAVLPSGDLLVASEIDRVAGVYRPDQTGALSLVSTHPVGLGAYWIEILPR